jgi:hypothetical protein
VHRFSDDQIWYTGVEPSNDRNWAIAQECMTIHTLWEDFRKARRGLPVSPVPRKGVGLAG